MTAGDENCEVGWEPVVKALGQHAPVSTCSTLPLVCFDVLFNL